MKKTKQIQVKFDQEEPVLKHINFFTKEQLEDIELMYMLTLYISHLPCCSSYQAYQRAKFA